MEATSAGWSWAGGGAAAAWLAAASAALCAHLVVAVLILGNLDWRSSQPSVQSHLQVELFAPQVPPAVEAVPVPVEAERRRGLGEAEAVGERPMQSPARRVPAEDAGAEDLTAVDGERGAALPELTDEDAASTAELARRVAASLSRQIRSAWKVPYSAAPGTRARVVVRLDRTGRIAGWDFVQTNGTDSFNASIVRVLQSIGSFSAVGLLPEAVYLERFRELVLLFDSESRRRL